MTWLIVISTFIVIGVIAKKVKQRIDQINEEEERKKLNKGASDSEDDSLVHLAGN